MGVSGFHKFLESRNLVQPIKRGFAIAALVIDLADLLHVNIRKSNTPTQLLKHVVNALKTILKHIRLKTSSGLPGSLVIMMDGPAPLAKLSLQIKRRRTQSARGKSENVKSKSNKGKSKKKGGGLSSLFLSPGTSLTNFLENGLRKAFPKAFISGCQEPGEGEIKAIHWLLTHRKRFQTERVMLLGGDADLVLLACAARPLTNITCGKSERGKFTGVNVDHFIRLFPNYTREDLCVVNFLRGNDYLPTLKGCTTEFSTRISKTIFEKGGLVDVKSGCLKAMGLLTLCQGIVQAGSIHSFSKMKIKSKSQSNETMQPQRECDGSDCHPCEYFNMVAWCLLMYRTGACPNVDYVYRYKSSPCCKHCCEYLTELKDTLIRFEPPGSVTAILEQKTSSSTASSTLPSTTPPPPPTPLSTSAALLLLIPRWGSQVLPKHLLPFMNHPELIHWYPSACTQCDVYRMERKQLLNKQELTIIEIKKSKEMTENEKKEQLNLLSIQRRTFEDMTQAHVKKEHPVLPPPVNIIRRLLGNESIGNDSPFSYPVVVPLNERKPTNAKGRSNDMNELINATSLLDLSVKTNNLKKTSKTSVQKTSMKKTSVQNNKNKKSGGGGGGICRGYQQNGNCKFGDSCRYKHVSGGSGGGNGSGSGSGIKSSSGGQRGGGQSGGRGRRRNKTKGTSSSSSLVPSQVNK